MQAMMSPAPRGRIALGEISMKRTALRHLVGLSALSLMPLGVEASGFALVENSASGMGNAFAGGGAIADDPSAVVFNPAGMIRLQGTQLLVAGHYISPAFRFSNNGSTDGLGNPLSGTNADGGVDAIVLNLYTVTELNDRWRFGMAVHAPFGMGTEYDDNWVGRYHALNSNLVTINFTPSIAYRVSDTLSLGLGLSAQYADVILSSAIDTGTLCVTQELLGVLPTGTCSTVGLFPQQSDGYAEISGSNWSYGWNAGVLLSPSPTQRISLSYRSEVVQDVDGRADFTLPGEAAFLSAASGAFVDTGAHAKVTLPASASLSYWQRLNDKVAVMADATWTNWSVFDELRIHYDNPDQPESVTTENWQDTWRYAVGMNYTLDDTKMLRAGLALDQGPVPDAEHRTPRVPDGDRRWLALGVRYKLSDEAVLNAGYAHLFVDTLEVNNTLESSIPTLNATLQGSYEGAADIFSLQFTRHF